MIDPILATAALLPSLLFLLWFLRASRRAPEPARVVAACYVAGCAAFGAAVLGLRGMEPLLAGLPATARMFVAVAPVEESLKLGAVLLAAGLPPRWGRMSSGLVYAVAASLGFAAVENIAYAERFGFETGLLRAFTAVPGHALHGALVGIQLGRANRGGGRSAVPGVLVGLLLASLAHGLYNALLLESPALRTLVVPLLLVEGTVLFAMLRRAREEDLSHIVDQLRDLPALRGAPTSSLRMLATRSLRRRIPPGERVFREGDPSKSVYLVLGGHMKVDRLTADPDDGDAREDVGHLDTGEFFGEVGVLLDRARSASVVAESDAMLLELSVTGLHEVVAVVDGLGEGLVDVAQGRGASMAQMPSLDELQRRAAVKEEQENERIDPDSVAGRLRAVPLLANLRVGVLRLLAAGAVRERRSRRGVLLRQGAPTRGLCVILEGRAAVSIDGEQVAELGEGDWFGEISLLTGFAASATVRSLTPMELVVLDDEALRGVVGLVPEVGEELLRRIRQRSELGAGRSRPRPHLHVRAFGALRRGAASLGFARAATETAEARQLLAAFPELLELPTAAAEALAELGAPERTGQAGVWLEAERPDVLAGWFLPEERISDALARCPHLLHVLARQAVREGEGR